MKASGMEEMRGEVRIVGVKQEKLTPMIEENEKNTSASIREIGNRQKWQEMET